MNRSLNTRLRRLERNVPDPVQALLDALSDEDLDVARAAICARIDTTRNGAADIDAPLLPEPVHRLFRAFEEVPVRHTISENLSGSERAVWAALAADDMADGPLSTAD